MKKQIFTLLLLMASVLGYTQTIDTVIQTKVYTSYFNYTLKAPVYITYSLYQGGGDCDRKAFHFLNDIPALKGHIATQADYAASGYDEGHLCNSQDEAGDCSRDQATFRFYNCLPQTKELNRGIWKTWETAIRKQSATDSLWIITGGTFNGNKTMGKDKVAVPDYCWKVVESETTHQIVEVILCDNTSTPNCQQISIEILGPLLPYKLPLK